VVERVSDGEERERDERIQSGVWWWMGLSK
jgi:hypothetical protein